MRRTALLFFLCVSLCNASVCFATNVVFVTAKYTDSTKPNKGRGLAFSKGNECYVLTARHVVDPSTSIEIIGHQNKRASALIEEDFSDDIAVLRITDNNDICKNYQWPVRDYFEDLVNCQEGFLILREETGGIGTIPVFLTRADNRFVTIRPRLSNDHISEMHSGSILIVKNKPAGILLTVSSQNGEGTVLRIDYIDGLIIPYSYIDEAPSQPGSKIPWHIF